MTYIPRLIYVVGTRVIEVDFDTCFTRIFEGLSLAAANIPELHVYYTTLCLLTCTLRGLHMGRVVS
jgi:hypothetical protein